MDRQIGLESSVDEYVETLVELFREMRRVMREDSVCFLNLGDSFNGSGGAGGDYGPGGLKEGQPKYPGRKFAQLKPKDLCGVPWRTALALQADGWWLRSDIIWVSNKMPESVTDRPTRSHEHIFLLAKSQTYFYDHVAIMEPATTGSCGSRFDTGKTGVSQAGCSTKDRPDYDLRNKRDVWRINSQPFSGAHFATFPPELPELCIKAGSSAQACEVCGAPWKREIETERQFLSGSGKSGNSITGKQDAVHGGGETKDIRRGPVTTIQTRGFRPSCTCENNGRARCLILDPFMGAGTTAMVARQLGRDYIGFELNPEYVKIAEQRIAQEAGPTLFDP